MVAIVFERLEGQIPGPVPHPTLDDETRDAWISLGDEPGLFFESQMKSYWVEVDYGLRESAALRRTSCSVANSNIVDGVFIPHGMSGIADIELHGYLTNEAIIDPKDLLWEWGNLGFRPANYAELYAFGAEHPSAQLQAHILAMGSWIGVGSNRRVPCLGHDGAARAAFLEYWNDVKKGQVFLLTRVQ